MIAPEALVSRATRYPFGDAIAIERPAQPAVAMADAIGDRTAGGLPLRDSDS